MPKRASGQAPRSGKHDARNRKSLASPARLAALEACMIVRVRNAYAQEVIAATIDRSALSAEDRSFWASLQPGARLTSSSTAA